MQYFNRTLELSEILKKKSLFLFGPRQTGKSSYIRNQLKQEDIAMFWTLLDGRLRLKITNDPGLLRQEIEERNLQDCIVVIDEIQKCPELLDEVHFLIEERNIHFLLTGSSARKLKNTGVNLLGGRASQRHMHPFTYPEVCMNENYNLNYIFAHGLLPSIYLSDDIDENLGAYTDTYLTEEISAEAVSRNIPAFSRFLQVAALTNSQVLNYTNIANDCKVRSQTVSQWYDILESTLLGYRINPYSKATKRKTITMPKFYFFDIAIARALKDSNVPSPGSTEFGEYFEQLVCMELKAWIDYKSPKSQLTYWRTTNQVEVDFCLDDDLAIEVKSTSNVTAKHLKGLKALREENIFKRYIVVCLEEHPRKVDDIEILPWKYFFEQLWKNQTIQSNKIIL